MFFVEMAWAGSSDASGPFNFRGCDLTARIPPRHGGCPGATPGNRTILRSEPTLRWVRAKDVLRSLGEGGRNRASGSELRMAGQFPQAARQLAQQSLQNSARSGQHRGGLPFSRGRGRQVMHLPCKQVDEGAIPSDSTILRSEPTTVGAGRRMPSIGFCEGGLISTSALSYGWRAIQLGEGGLFSAWIPSYGWQAIKCFTHT